MLSPTTSLRYIFYGPNMKHFAKYFRSLKRSMTIVTQQNQQGKSTDVQITSLYSKLLHDPEFPLPGNIAVDLKSLPANSNVQVKPQLYQSLATAFLELGAEAMNKQHIISHMIQENAELAREDVSVKDMVATIVLDSIYKSKVEFTIQECPKRLEKRFRDFFSDVKENLDNLTVITITQHTVNDMAVWSEEVDEEREALTDVFIDSAQKICEEIKNSGYWADFIDPTSGHAFYSENRNNTLFETDDCFNHLGFLVEDLGCCKVLQHKQWKGNIFVGVLFTNATPESRLFDSEQ